MLIRCLPAFRHLRPLLFTTTKLTYNTEVYKKYSYHPFTPRKYIKMVRKRLQEKSRNNSRTGAAMAYHHLALFMNEAIPFNYEVYEECCVSLVQAQKTVHSAYILQAMQLGRRHHFTFNYFWNCFYNEFHHRLVQYIQPIIDRYHKRIDKQFNAYSKAFDYLNVDPFLYLRDEELADQGLYRTITLPTQQQLKYINIDSSYQSYLTKNYYKTSAKQNLSYYENKKLYQYHFYSAFYKTEFRNDKGRLKEMSYAYKIYKWNQAFNINNIRGLYYLDESVNEDDLERSKEYNENKYYDYKNAGLKKNKLKNTGFFSVNRLVELGELLTWKGTANIKLLSLLLEGITIRLSLCAKVSPEWALGHLRLLMHVCQTNMQEYQTNKDKYTVRSIKRVQKLQTHYFQEHFILLDKALPNCSVYHFVALTEAYSRFPIKRRSTRKTIAQKLCHYLDKKGIDKMPILAKLLTLNEKDYKMDTYYKILFGFPYLPYYKQLTYTQLLKKYRRRKAKAEREYKYTYDNQYYIDVNNTEETYIDNREKPLTTEKYYEVKDSITR